MNMKKVSIFIVPLLLGVIIISSAIYYNNKQNSSQEQEEITIKPCEDFLIFAPGGILSIKIALPVNYDSSQNIASIYLLDANYFFTKTGSLDNLIDRKDGMTAISSRLIDNAEIPPSILVGISYNEEKRMELTLQGSPSFYGFFKNDLIPEVEARCKVSKSSEDRILFGYSASAHFSTYTLMRDMYEDTHTFDKYISIAGVYTPFPPMTDNWATDLLLKITNEKELNAFSERDFYFAVGTEDALLIENQELKESVSTRDYQNFNFNYVEYNGYGHYDIPEIAYEDGMRWIFCMQQDFN